MARNTAVYVTAAILRLGAIGGLLRILVGIVALWTSGAITDDAAWNGGGEIGEIHFDSLDVNIEMSRLDGYANVRITPTWPGTVVNLAFAALCVIVALRPVGLARLLVPKAGQADAEQGVAPNRSLPPSLNSTSSVRGSEDF
jgi:hypothetical protein